jgi:hypothetical protein
MLSEFLLFWASRGMWAESLARLSQIWTTVFEANIGVTLAEVLARHEIPVLVP